MTVVRRRPSFAAGPRPVALCILVSPKLFYSLRTAALRADTTPELLAADVLGDAFAPSEATVPAAAQHQST